MNNLFVKKNTKYKLLKNCLCCKSNHINLLLDLGIQPLANDFHKLNETCDIFPLQLIICNDCFHCQLFNIVDPNILFKNYKYVSGTSNTGLEFFKNNAQFINEYYETKFKNNYKTKKILDIACNDGSQLDYFKELGWDTFGIDPATNICPIALNKGHKIICDFFNMNSIKMFDKMDVILAQNVFAHTEYIDEFLKACKCIMHEKSSLFIQTSQKDMIINGEFDTIYHEHISFFNTNSMNILVTQNGLQLNRVLEKDIHGKSYMFEINLKKNEELYNVDNYINYERNIGLYQMDTYNKFKINAENIIYNIKVLINNYVDKGFKCIGFGAAAKGQTILCYGNIQLDYIIDENPLKIGLYSPKLNIPIVGLEHFAKDPCEKIAIIILAWNFESEIKQKITNLDKYGEICIIDNYFEAPKNF